MHLECINPAKETGDVSLDNLNPENVAGSILCRSLGLFNMCYSLDADIDIFRLCETVLMQNPVYNSSDPSDRADFCEKVVSEAKKMLKEEFRQKEKNRKILIKILGDPKFWNNVKHELRTEADEPNIISIFYSYYDVLRNPIAGRVLGEIFIGYWHIVRELKDMDYTEDQWRGSVPKYAHCAALEGMLSSDLRHFMPYERIIRQNSSLIVQNMREAL